MLTAFEPKPQNSALQVGNNTLRPVAVINLQQDAERSSAFTPLTSGSHLGKGSLIIEDPSLRSFRTRFSNSILRLRSSFSFVRNRTSGVGNVMILPFVDAFLINLRLAKTSIWNFIRWPILFDVFPRLCAG
jgi:hypothetical protein